MSTVICKENNGIWIPIKVGASYGSYPIPSKKTGNSQYFKFKRTSEDQSTAEKLDIMTVHFNAGDDEVMEIKMTKNTMTKTLTTYLTGCGTFVKEMKDKDKGDKIIYTLEFPLKQKESGQSSHIFIHKDDEVFLSLTDEQCGQKDGSKWFYSSTWYSGSLTFPIKQEVDSIKMLKTDNHGEYESSCNHMLKDITTSSSIIFIGSSFMQRRGVAFAAAALADLLQ